MTTSTATLARKPVPFERDGYRDRNRAFVVRQRQEAYEHREEARAAGNTAMVAALDAVMAGYGRALADLDNPGTPGWLAAERARTPISAAEFAEIEGKA